MAPLVLLVDDDPEVVHTLRPVLESRPNLGEAETSRLGGVYMLKPVVAKQLIETVARLIATA